MGGHYLQAISPVDVDSIDCALQGNADKVAGLGVAECCFCCSLLSAKVSGNSGAQITGLSFAGVLISK